MRNRKSTKKKKKPAKMLSITFLNDKLYQHKSRISPPIGQCRTHRNGIPAVEQPLLAACSTAGSASWHTLNTWGLHSLILCIKKVLP